MVPCKLHVRSITDMMYKSIKKAIVTSFSVSSHIIIIRVINFHAGFEKNCRLEMTAFSGINDHNYVD